MEIALKEFPKLSSAELARICAVGDQLVSTVRAAIQPRESRGSETRIGADGKERKMPAKTPGMKLLESMGAQITANIVTTPPTGPASMTSISLSTFFYGKHRSRKRRTRYLVGD